MVSTNYRPVPLRHHLYTGGTELHKVLDQGGDFDSKAYRWAPPPTPLPNQRPPTETKRTVGLSCSFVFFFSFACMCCRCCSKAGEAFSKKDDKNSKPGQGGQRGGGGGRGGQHSFGGAGRTEWQVESNHPSSKEDSGGTS